MEVIKIEEKYYILASSDRAAECTRVLKHGETFAIFDCHGDIQPLGLGEQGIFHEGTRYLSKLELRFGGMRPLLLGSAVKQNELLAIDLMNPDFTVDDVQIRRDSIHIYRSKLIFEGTCHEQLRLTNFSLESVRMRFTVNFEADFADIFEVRGTKRQRRGAMLPVETSASVARLSYLGVDGELRVTQVSFSPQPEHIGAGEASYAVLLEPKSCITIDITTSCGRHGLDIPIGFIEAQKKAHTSLLQLKRQYSSISTDNAHFNILLERSQADLMMMMTSTDQGDYPYAGVPWFSTAFGRDGIITALETLWVNPAIARGVLSYLAATQARELDPDMDAEPGKIIHETRMGEMAALKEIPFGRYYGSVDSTPLFVALAGAYFRRTADLELIAEIWENITAALNWIDVYGDADGDGFVEYARHSPDGLVQQGWKDSNDSVFHADGALAEAPIALCEVQGYVYDAKLGAADMAAALGHAALADQLREQARTLKEKFEEAFWCEDMSFYALALDGAKRPCKVRSSNAGHCLYSGIAKDRHAGLLATELMSENFYSGWGVRTIASCERRYNPMSYHNGSIWPHDTALVASGLARYGFTDGAMTILAGIFEASLSMDLQRLPELFCGFNRHELSSPVLYPVACAPQSWAAASVFLLLQACIGLSVDASAQRVTLAYPALPVFLDQVTINDLRVMDGCAIDIVLKRHDNDVAVSIVRKEGAAEVIIIK